MTEYHIKKYKNDSYRLLKMPIQFKNKYKNNHKIYVNKLSQSISRAKNNIIDLCLCNHFNYFITITIDSIYNRIDLKNILSMFNNIIKYQLIKGYKINYIIIPEIHKKGGYHLHGFFNGIDENSIYINDNGFFSITTFDTMGFTSISKIRNYESTIFYLLKYIGKGFNNIEKNQHLYYHSRGLKKSRTIIKFYGDDILPLNYDYYNNYNCIKNLNYNSFKHLLKCIKDNNKIYYGF